MLLPSPQKEQITFKWSRIRESRLESAMSVTRGRIYLLIEVPSLFWFPTGLDFSHVALPPLSSKTAPFTHSFLPESKSAVFRRFRCDQTQWTRSGNLIVLLLQQSLLWIWLEAGFRKVQVSINLLLYCQTFLGMTRFDGWKRFAILLKQIKNTIKQPEGWWKKCKWIITVTSCLYALLGEEVSTILCPYSL